MLESRGKDLLAWIATRALAGHIIVSIGTAVYAFTMVPRTGCPTNTIKTASFLTLCLPAIWELALLSLLVWAAILTATIAWARSGVVDRA